MTHVLGIHMGHDQSACLLADGEIVCLIEEERLTRVKHGLPKSVRGLWRDFNGHFGYFPWASLSYCLATRGLGLDDLDLLVLPEEANTTAVAALLPIKDRKKIYIADQPAGGEHHWRHALSAFYASPFEKAAVLVIDGDGSMDSAGYEAESGYLFTGRNGVSRDVFKNRYPTSGHPATGFRCGLGWTYDYVSAVLGFVNTKIAYLSEPGKTMGLAPYGKESEWLSARWIVSDGWNFDFTAFHEFLRTSGLANLVSFEDRGKALVQNENAISQDAKNLAWKVQNELERAILHLAQRLHDETGAKDLCLAGGVALNSVANGLLLEKGPFERIFVQPAAADNGQAIGLAYQGQLRIAPTKPIHPIRHAFGGREYGREEIRSFLAATGLVVTELESDDALVQDLASELARGHIVGWFQGGSEYGPRALGHRSILADPRGDGMKDHLNARVKFREPFRPFAPSVLREKASTVFDLAVESPYMLMVADVRSEWRDRVPAITHVDGTARIQTVDRAVDPLYHAAISAFEKETGVPLVLNTSFNLRGQPVVESPRDALQCFAFTEMDVLYLGRFKVLRPEPKHFLLTTAPGWRLIVENEISRTGSTRTLRFESTGEKKQTVPVRPIPALIALCGSFDGKRTLADALREGLGGQAPDSAVTTLALQFVQSLLRAGALKARLGSLDL